MSEDAIGSRPIWETFARALGAEPRQHRSIKGASGLDHPVEAIAVDDKEGRIIVFSAEPDSRVAALMQGDVQATMPNARVLVARPIAFDLSVMARQVAGFLGSSELDLARLEARLKELGEERGQEAVKERIGPFIQAAVKLALPALPQILSVIQQAAYIDWAGALKAARDGDLKSFSLSLDNLLRYDNLANDREYGVCPLPLYEFSDLDWELFLSGERLDDVRERLRQLDILQYFYPPPDQLAIGLVDRGLSTEAAVINAVEIAPELGHPFGNAEIIQGRISVPILIDELQQRKLLVEGEVGLEVTPSGNAVRANIKFRPRESLVSKLLQRFQLNVSLKPTDFMR